MRMQEIVVFSLLVPAFLAFNSDISWERLSIKSIHRIGDRTSVKSKLEELGLGELRNYENFRYRQLILSVLVATVELLIFLLTEIGILQAVLLATTSVCLVIYALERRLESELKSHRAAIESDFPAIVEMLTLALSAGETPLSGMQRISQRAVGALAREFSRVISEVSLGTPFADSLDAMGRRVHSLAVRRFIDALVIAINRGAPIIEVLHSHAREARDLQRNRVLGAAAKAELSMMIPVIFLILPISILFALWPSLSNLNLFAQG